MALDTLAIRMGKLGAGRWQLHLEDDESIEVVLDDVDVDEQRGFSAEGRSEEREMLYELTTGKQPGGPIRLRRRPFDGEDWEDAGELVEAVKLDGVG